MGGLLFSAFEKWQWRANGVAFRCGDVRRFDSLILIYSKCKSWIYCWNMILFCMGVLGFVLRASLLFCGGVYFVDVYFGGRLKMRFCWRFLKEIFYRGWYESEMEEIVIYFFWIYDTFLMIRIIVYENIIIKNIYSNSTI